MELNEILQIALRGGASDIHLKAGLPPMFRVDGSLVPLKDGRRLPPEEVARMAFGIMNEFQKEKFKVSNEVDLAYGVPGLGRFRVTQKADLSNPQDVYRSENVAPEDWVMVGNHDTKSLWRLVGEWQWRGTLRAQADYLATRLHPEPQGREAFARQLAANPGLLAQAKIADLFACRARHVMVFFADLLGMTETYNVPGTVEERNWSLRVPEDWARQYRERLRESPNP